VKAPGRRPGWTGDGLVPPGRTDVLRLVGPGTAASLTWLVLREFYRRSWLRAIPTGALLARAP
jgi:hypothetical protein